MILTGYKAYIGVVLIGLGAALRALGYGEIGAAVESLGAMLGIAGVRSKQDRPVPGQ